MVLRPAAPWLANFVINNILFSGSLTVFYFFIIISLELATAFIKTVSKRFNT